MVRKGIKTSNVAVTPPAKVKIEDLVKWAYSQAMMIIPSGHAKKTARRSGSDNARGPASSEQKWKPQGIKGPVLQI